MRNREKQRIEKKKEKMLQLNNQYGFYDPTPFQAIKKIIRKEERNERKNEH